MELLLQMEMPLCLVLKPSFEHKLFYLSTHTKHVLMLPQAYRGQNRLSLMRWKSLPANLLLKNLD